jgi:group I intron endonuclease
MGFIYKITNIVSGKCYIGETKEETPEARWRRHILSVKSNVGCPALKDAIKKYGLNSFRFEVLIICFDEDRFIYEKQYIKKYNSQVPNGYNILPGGIGGAGFLGKRHTEESINKIVETGNKFREKNPNHFETYREKHKKSMENVDISTSVKNSEKFKKALEEGRVGAKAHKNTSKEREDTTKTFNIKNHIEVKEEQYTYKDCKNKNTLKENKSKDFTKHSTIKKEIEVMENIEEKEKAHINGKLSEETKEKIRNSVLKYYENKGNDQKINIEKHRELMAKAVGKKVAQYTEDNEFIKEYISVREAERGTKVPRSSIQNSVNGKSKTAGGFIWKYAPIENLKDN